MIQCTAHPSKGDMPAFEGYSQEEEEELERCAIMNLNHILHGRERMGRYFSKELSKLADPYYYSSSDDDSPPPRRKQQKNKAAMPAPAARSSKEPEVESAPEESNEDMMASMADFFALSQ